jgi:hypothetical protein
MVQWQVVLSKSKNPYVVLPKQSPCYAAKGLNQHSGKPLLIIVFAKNLAENGAPFASKFVPADML